jgi:hypothetical protein
MIKYDISNNVCGFPENEINLKTSKHQSVVNPPSYDSTEKIKKDK